MYHIAIVTSQFNQAVTEKLTLGAKEYFNTVQNKIATSDYFKVPGAVELPLFAARLAQTKKYDAILILGAVIYGETDHYDSKLAMVVNVWRWTITSPLFLVF